MPLTAARHGLRAAAAGQVWAQAAGRAPDGRGVCARLRGVHAGCSATVARRPRPRTGAGSARRGGGNRWARRSRATQPRGREQRSPPCRQPPAARRCRAMGSAWWAAPARSEVGAAKGPLLWQRLRCGPGGEEFPQLHARQRARRRKPGLNGLRA